MRAFTEADQFAAISRLRAAMTQNECLDLIDWLDEQLDALGPLTEDTQIDLRGADWPGWKSVAERVALTDAQWQALANWLGTR